MAPKPISRGQMAQREGFASKLNDLGCNIHTAAAAYNKAVAEYNAALDDVREWRDEISENIEEYIENKSEKWQDSEKGAAWRDLKAEWDNIDLDEVEEIEVDDIPHDESGDVLADLRDEPETD